MPPAKSHFATLPASCSIPLSVDRGIHEAGVVVDDDIHLSTSCLLARDALPHGRARLVPATSVIHDLHHRKHDRNLDQDTNHSRQGRAGVESKEANRSSDGQFKKVAGADERGRTSNAMRLARDAIQEISEPRIEIDLNQDRHRQDRNDQGLCQDLFALESE